MTGQDKTSAKAARIGWILYDWASSPIPTLHATFVFAVYFTTVIMPEGGSAAWAWMTGSAALLVAIVAPFAGRLADSRGQIKSGLVACLLIGAVATAGLWFAYPDQNSIALALGLSLISIFFMELSFVYYNAMLSRLSPAGGLGRLSGTAWGIGYAGAILALVLVLAILILPETPPFGLDKGAAEHVRATMVFAGLWAVLFSLPMIRFTPSLPATPQQGRLFDQLVASIRTAAAIPGMIRFLLARMAFNDGLVTLFAFGGIYAARVFEFTQTEILAFAILLNITAGLGAAVGGMADDKFGSLTTLRWSLWGLFGFGLLAILAPSKLMFWIIGALLGLFVGPCQAVSRSWVARHAPDQDKASLFGLFMVSGKLTSFAGPFCYGLLVLATGSERAGMAIVLVLVGLGLYLLPKSEMPAGSRPA